MQPDFVQQALKALRPDTPNWYGWAKVDADGNKIPNDQRMCWEHAIVIQDGVTKPTEAEFDAKVAELQAAYDEANAPYKLSRAAEPERYGGERVVLRLGGDGSGERDRVRERKYVDHRSGFETGDVERFRAVRGGIGRGGDAPARSRTLERER